MVFGPVYDKLIAGVRQYDDTQAEHNLYVRYVKRVVVICRTVQLSRSFPALVPALDGFMVPGQRTPRKWTRQRYGSCSRGNGRMSKSHDLPDKCMLEI